MPQSMMPRSLASGECLIASNTLSSVTSLVGSSYFSVPATEYVSLHEGHSSLTNSLIFSWFFSCTVMVKTKNPPYRAVSSFGAPMQTSSPLTKIPNLSQRTEASSMLCVVKMTPLPDLPCLTTFHRFCLLAGSSPVEGSSKYTTEGFPMNEMATDSLRFIPPLNVLTCLSATPPFSRLTDRNASVTAFSSCSPENRFKRA
mmetsp:Transcript_6429/g.12715  ORF Transcript_6429/g.12715 Transcript_6429/m.12715 type:complete len:200 (-) Transcript_6429:942-1541(-)